MSDEGTFPVKPGQKTVMPPVWKRYSKDEFLKCLYDNMGVVTASCSVLDCTMKQFYMAVDRWSLRDELAKAREGLISLAEKALLECLTSEDEHVKLQAATTCLRLGGQRSGWSQNPQTVIQQQVNVNDRQAAVNAIFGIEDAKSS